VACVSVGDIEIGTGMGYSKKESHQMAAKEAIQRIRDDKALRQTLISTTKKDTDEKSPEPNETDFDDLNNEFLSES
jgi:ribonuclease-3